MGRPFGQSLVGSVGAWAGPASQRLAASLRRTLRSEDGSFSILNVMLMVTVISVSGIAIDVVRFEARRAKVQNTLDRAILAAADMNQTLTPTEVVDSYFAKAGLADVTPTPQTPSSGAHSVYAQASAPMDTFFMRMFGINTLSPTAQGKAEESISDIEISLVLDISGSMTENITNTSSGSSYGSRNYKRSRYGGYQSSTTKLEALQDAADEFIDTIFASTATGRTSMSIVPYAAEVNVGKDLLSQYNVDWTHDTNACVDFDANDYNGPELPVTQVLHQTDYVDPYGYYYGYAPRAPSNLVCRTDDASKVLPLSGDKEALKAKVKGLWAGGNTAIDVGLKWGIALLDPSAKPAVEALTKTDPPVIDPNFAARPYGYGDKQTMKVVVVMTDGQNTDQNELKSQYKDQLSDVWKYTDGNGNAHYSYKVYEGNNKDLDGDYVRDEPFWIDDEPKYLSCGYYCSSYNGDKWQSRPTGGDAAVNLTWRQVFTDMSVAYHAEKRAEITGKGNDYDKWADAPVSPRVTSYYKDTRMDLLCRKARDEGIIIFAIAFETNDTNAKKLKKCASSDAHFYDVNGLEMTTAFQSIANAIGKLRLTQ